MSGIMKELDHNKQVSSPVDRSYWVKQLNLCLIIHIQLPGAKRRTPPLWKKNPFVDKKHHLRGFWCYKKPRYPLLGPKKKPLWGEPPPPPGAEHKTPLFAPRPNPTEKLKPA